MNNQAEEQEEQIEHEGKFYCGICGWADISEYPHIHKSQDASTFTAVDSCEAEARRMIDQGVQGVRVENGVIFFQESEENMPDAQTDAARFILDEYCWLHTDQPNGGGWSCVICRQDIEWRQERRRLFIALMRKPEMQILRLALRYLSFDRGIDWRRVKSWEIVCNPPRPDGSLWILVTDKFQIDTIWYGHPDMNYNQFTFEWLHDPSSARCRCEHCTAVRHAMRTYSRMA